MGCTVAQERAAGRAAVLLRRYSRSADRRAIDPVASTGDSDRRFPKSVFPPPEESVLPADQKLEQGRDVDSPIIDNLSEGAKAAIVRHVTLCEALCLPEAFHMAALSCHLSTTRGVLALSAPHVPTDTAASLLQMCRLVGPLVAARSAGGGPRLAALHIPAKCLAGPHNAELAAALQPLVTALRSLTITHGQVAYEELERPCHLRSAAVTPLLAQLSPAKLRSLAIDAIVDVNAEPVHERLAALTKLTHLRVSGVPRSLASMASLRSVHLMHVANVSNKDMLNLTSNARGGVQAYGEAAAAERVHRAILQQPHTADGVKGDVYCAAGHQPGDGGRKVFCCGSSLAGCRASLLTNRVPRFDSALCSTSVHAVRYELVRDAWGAAPQPAAGLEAPPGSSNGVPWAEAPLATMHALCITTADDAAAHSEGVTGITRNLLLHQDRHGLHELGVTTVDKLPPRSVLAFRQKVQRARQAVAPRKAARLDKDSRAREFLNASGRGWVTTRSSGISHSVCSLEMLERDSPRIAARESNARGAREMRQPGDQGPGLHVLHFSGPAIFVFQV